VFFSLSRWREREGVRVFPLASNRRPNVAVEPEQVHRVGSVLDRHEALVHRPIVSGDLDP
jgi:hypothetical protein